jgi:hypothetical protein
MTALLRAARDRDRYGAQALLLASVLRALGINHGWRLPS